MISPPRTTAKDISSSLYISVAKSSPGIINEKKLAASITPAAKPKEVSSNFSVILFTKKTGIAPIEVAIPAKKLAIKAISTISILKNYCNSTQKAISLKIKLATIPAPTSSRVIPRPPWRFSNLLSGKGFQTSNNLKRTKPHNKFPIVKGTKSKTTK